MKNSRGQITIEYLLMLIVMFGLSLTFSKFARSQEWMKSLVSGPWKPLKAMMEDGVWISADSKKYHPHHRKRHGSYEADKVPGDGSDQGDMN